MSEFTSILNSIKNEEYPAKKRLCEYLLELLTQIRNGRKKLEKDSAEELLSFVFGEADEVIEGISKAVTDRERDDVFAYGDAVFSIGVLIEPCKDNLPKDFAEKLERFAEESKKSRKIEECIDSIFRNKEEEKIPFLLSLLENAKDEYQKGKLYHGLTFYKSQLSSLRDDSKKLLRNHIFSDMERWLKTNSFDEEAVNVLELASDVCKFLADDKMVEMLYKIIKLGYGNVCYYAVESLLYLKKDILKEDILSLAKNCEYAALTYDLLKKYGKTTLFPEEYSQNEYLAKSDLIHWLTYPTELGKIPDVIEYMGKITYLFRKDVYYVFKYRSDSDNLSDDLKNEWLIGWSCDNGGTFSNFDKLSSVDKGSVQKTLKFIKKNIIG